ncbi:kinase-like domain-containing protein [Rhizophagus clarus]|uniref:Kinase-like domain-containing protein n=1 Tax=Rhizophagus clarus TaxID=94130 RepID=A0A8H3KNR7_9GLOM|nr:kinase-like domain-containing protein [Rhizophagus clarus]
MADTRLKFIINAINRSETFMDYNINDDITKLYERQKQAILNDNSLTNDEKTEAINLITRAFNSDKILSNEGTRRLCENCSKECLATSYCEHCVRTYLKNNFSNWTSENNEVDDLIQECQMKSLYPDQIIEWIPYNNLQNIEYITKGGCSEIYSAIWIDGSYIEWNSEEQQLKRSGTFKVILKKLENVESANRSWLYEAKSHLSLVNKFAHIVKCFGLTQDASTGDYMLVMEVMVTDLRNYLQHQRTWKEKINAVYNIAYALRRIHYYNTVHRDLHSGNILLNNDCWYIGDFGFCGPADKPLNSIYGNLPYVAPEVIIGKEYTFASDIYSVGIIMWEVSSGQLPFNNYEHNFDLAMKIVNGMRPRIKSGIPSEYKKLMKQCWDADPSNRPDINTLYNGIKKIRRVYFNNNNANEFNPLENNNNSSQSNLSSGSTLTSSSKSNSLSTSKLYRFENLPEPTNATEEEQEAFHSTPYDFDIPDNVEDEFNNNLPNGQDELGISEVIRIEILH